MHNSTTRPIRRTSKPTKRCYMCRRALTGSPKEIPGMGFFGSECASKVAGIESYLQSQGLSDLLTGGFLVDTNKPEQQRKAYTAIRKLEQIGIKVSVVKRSSHTYFISIVATNKILLKRNLKAFEADVLRVAA